MNDTESYNRFTAKKCSKSKVPILFPFLRYLLEMHISRYFNFPSGKSGKSGKIVLQIVSQNFKFFGKSAVVKVSVRGKIFQLLYYLIKHLIKTQIEIPN